VANAARLENGERATRIAEELARRLGRKVEVFDPPGNTCWVATPAQQLDSRGRHDRGFHWHSTIGEDAVSQHQFSRPISYLETVAAECESIANLAVDPVERRRYQTLAKDLRQALVGIEAAMARDDPKHQSPSIAPGVSARR
jgi:hypothetical protein